MYALSECPLVGFCESSYRQDDMTEAGFVEIAH